MKRILSKHLSGSKANQEEAFRLDQFRELTFGRDAGANVKYDADRDDSVSRSHAKIACDPQQADKFTVTDLNSRNGVLLNKARVSGSATLGHGDVIQLGADGPEFMFTLDPPPPGVLRATRAVDAPASTREARGAATTASTFGGPRPAGRETVERLITETRSESRKWLINGAAVLAGVIVLVAGALIYTNTGARQEIAAAAKKTEEVKAEVKDLRSSMTPKEIVAKFGPATVYLDVSWKLIDTRSGGQVYHGHVKNKPAYIRRQNGEVEPFLTTRSNGTPIGENLKASGFVVSSDGFILTNRHVASPWLARYPLNAGTLYRLNHKKEIEVEQENYRMTEWIPGQWGKHDRRPGEPAQIEGRHDRFEVTFANTKSPIKGAKLVRTSDQHDVALIKIDSPQLPPPVELAAEGEDGDVKPGDPITVLGYPSVSPTRSVATQSRDMLAPGVELAAVREPTVTPGVIGNMSQGEADKSRFDYYSTASTYQLTANATGPGNSGGPVFNDRGRVIGIFYARNDNVSFAVPIRFGRDLTRVSQ
jgi:serine protease Do